jgi:outer membrane receptor for ferrienterochelin and colicins
MKKILLLIVLAFCSIIVHAQSSLILIIKNSETGAPLSGATATLLPLNRTAVADSLGKVIFEGIADGKYKLRVSFVGLKEMLMDIRVPLPADEAFEVLLEESEEHEEEVIITSTRISRTIANIPTRVEVISGEELEEKGNMKPGDIRMLLNETTGIQTQQTSATSYNAGIRIQGLEGRYTQILRDGYPLYAGFSGGLSLLQIAPLDLKQVEVIKGAASTLYGGGAIAGLVNLVSKTPGENREINLLANGTSAGGLDLSGFYSERFGKAGLTIFASRNSNKAFDPAGIGLTAIPKFERYTINPRVFLYGENTTADIGISYITEDRVGGSLDYIKNGGNGFFEKNNTDRITTQFGITHKLNERSILQFKNSFSRFDRSVSIPSYGFEALQQSSFSEITWSLQGERTDWIIGANIVTENLKESPLVNFPLRDYRYNTYGIFIQNEWSVSDKFIVESGLRGDHVNEFGFEVLPRISLMLKISPQLTSRLGGGFGYKLPTIFTEEAERIQFQNLFPIDMSRTSKERSAGANWDINYRTSLGDVDFSFNHLFFYTRLRNPLVMIGAPGGKVELRNSPGYLDTRGMETNMRFAYHDLKLFIGYTYTDANTNYQSNNKQWLPLTARHRLNNVLMYEIEDKLKIGLEAYYFGKQKLNDGSFGRSYWIMGLMGERIFEKFSIFINFENFNNTRQSRFNEIYTGTINNPVFKDIYAPVEGFVVNGGFKFRL